MPFPRIVLLTQWAPDARYAGAEALRRVVSCLPQDRLIWCSLCPASTKPNGVECRLEACAPRPLHWRLKGGVVETIWTQEVQAAGLARHLAALTDDFKPELLWVLPELAAINVGYHLHKTLGVPMHATIYDALESARELALPPTYYPLYWSRVRRFFSAIRSFDTISEGLRDHVRANYGVVPDVTDCVVPSSVPVEWMAGKPGGSGQRAAGNGCAVRRIAFCGAMRCSAGQWQGFLDQLATLPYRFEFDAYAWQDSIPKAQIPENVNVNMMPYLVEERKLIRRLHAGGYDASYLALWLEPEKRQFCRTSLSSKLTTYVAAGLPVIYHGPPDSEAWRLISSHNAGVFLTRGQPPSSRKEGLRRPWWAVGSGREALEGNLGQLMRVFSDEKARQEMAAGARRLCEQEFCLEQNVGRLCGLLGSLQRF